MTFHDESACCFSDELESERERVRGEKREVQRRLHEYEEEFYARHGRAVNKKDRGH